MGQLSNWECRELRESLIFSCTVARNFQQVNYAHTCNLPHEQPVKELVANDKTAITDARFGVHSIEQQNFPRNVQVSAKLKF